MTRRDRRADLVPMWTPEDERNLARRVQQLAARRDRPAVPWSELGAAFARGERHVRVQVEP